ncbi:MAG TPA: gluconate 2-dehydrogenase subunit 3 family protein [Blastocatellia bacterium]|nr:gluconate 2-dehydrogenase subunit 3 family protein [Blastocatellia bacterium]
MMNTEDVSRRLFLIRSLTGVSSAWLALRLPEIISAQEHAHHAAQSEAPTKLEFFSAEQATEIEAVAAQIIPTDDTPGAREARVIYFIDRALTTFDKEKQPQYVKGLRELQVKQKKMFKNSAKFSSLSSDDQIKVLKSIEKSAFFETVRVHTIIGFFADPSYGGNYDKIGWKLIGFQDDFYFKPPFGYYDREYNEAK